jgi:hypothetical protein
MHATRDTADVIERKLAGGRVMRGVMPLFFIVTVSVLSQL